METISQDTKYFASRTALAITMIAALIYCLVGGALPSFSAWLSVL